MKIDFVSDVACPWCAVGLAALEQALQRIGSDIDIELHFQPFELNPDMAPEGEDAMAHLARKYGRSPEELAASRETIRQRGAAEGFEFGTRARIWNTFDAHRLLHWAGLHSAQAQRSLKMALLKAYHGQGENPGASEVLLRLVAELGLDVEGARTMLQSGQYADEVRALERRWHSLGITAVPSVIINDRHLIQGGQPSQMVEQALRQLAAG